ncbi:MAG: hypothetical protein ACTSPG_10150 [Candidatus Hodarchaeales archaeon]
MSWKTRKKGTVRQKGKRFKTKDIYITKVDNKKFVLSLTDNPGPLRMSCAQLEVAFEKVISDSKKRKKILKLINSMANKAKARGIKTAEEAYRSTYKHLAKKDRALDNTEKLYKNHRVVFKKYEDFDYLEDVFRANSFKPEFRRNDVVIYRKGEKYLLVWTEGHSRHSKSDIAGIMYYGSLKDIENKITKDIPKDMSILEFMID